MRRILAVDDNDDILEVMQFVLEEHGYIVDTLADGTHLFEKIEENMPDLILMDVLLGNADGRELCHHIKNNAETRDIPVILVSASHNMASSINHDNGPDDFLAKPFDISALINKVEAHLKTAA